MTGRFAGNVVDLMVPGPGWRRCCICFTARQEHELFQDPHDGGRWDVCAVGRCAEQAGLIR